MEKDHEAVPDPIIWSVLCYSGFYERKQRLEYEGPDALGPDALEELFITLSQDVVLCILPPSLRKPESHKD